MPLADMMARRTWAGLDELCFFCDNFILIFLYKSFSNGYSRWDWKLERLQEASFQ